MKNYTSYAIFYRLNWKESIKEWQELNYEQIVAIIKQLNNWFASFNWDLIHWFSSLNYIKIEWRDYDRIWPYWKEILWESQDFQGIVTKNYYSINEMPEEMKQSYGEYDITNDIFIECKVWPQRNIISQIFLRWTILVVNWEEFTLTEKSKVRESFDLIIRAKNYFWKNILTYEQLLEIFKQQAYTELTVKDINCTKMNDLVKKNLDKIEIKIGKRIFAFKTQNVIIDE